MGKVAASRWASRAWAALAHAGLAALAYAPVLTIATGRVAADTRQSIYLDPDRFLSRVFDMWDAHAHLGSVTHQNIGLAFPMGTFFWATHHLGVPVWVAQRLWLGSILFAAGAGMLYLARTLCWRGVGPVVAAVVYMSTPYVLQYSTRTSILLLPWAGLPWLVGLTARALGSRGWRHPALFALVALIVGSVNATTMLLVCVAPVAWIAFAVWVRREIDLTDALRVGGRILALTTVVSVWWIVALVIEGRYGLPVLSFTETVDQVATTSTASEVLRGLGYWLFYTGEPLAPNVNGSRTYLENVDVITVTFVLPLLAFVAAFVVRWRHRTYFMALIALGVVIGIGAYPTENLSPLGRVFHDFASGSTVGLALRSTTRIVPVVVLGIAVLVGALITAVEARLRVLAVPAGAVVVGLAIFASPAIASGQLVDPNQQRPEAVPRYWVDAAEYVDAHAKGTRILEIPGIQFAAYRWGTTFEPISPGLMETPTAAREQQPFGTPASADLLIALDRRMQEGVFEPEALAPVARILSAGQVLLRSDLAYERYGAPRPRVLWRLLESPPEGLGEPVGFGEAVENRPDPRLPLLDAQTLSLPPDATDPPPVAVFAVADAPKIAYAVPSSSPIVLAGDGEGLVDAATAGLVTGDSLVLYAASSARDPALLQRALDQGAILVVTDTNRRRERRWRSTRNNTGYTLGANESPRHRGSSQGEADLVTFPGAGSEWQTVTEQIDGRVTASNYGGPITFEPDARPAAAFDGDPATAWRIGPLTDAVGESLTVEVDEPIETDHISLLQRQGTYFATEIELRFDGGHPLRVVLDTSSRELGQVISFPARRFSELEIEITGATETFDAAVFGRSPVQFTEITIPGVQLGELVRLPTAPLERAGRESADHALSFVLTRLRGNPKEPERLDEEATIARVFSVPTARTFSLTGTARLSQEVPDTAIDEMLGLPTVQQGGVLASSSRRLAGDLAAIASSTIDGDPDTAWVGSFEEVDGASLRYAFPSPRRLSHLDLQVVADGRHSVPTQVRIDVSGEVRVVDLPVIEDAEQSGATVTVPIDFAPATGSDVIVTFVGIRPVEKVDALSRTPIVQPLSVAEIGFPGVLAWRPSTLPGACRDDLLTVDGRPVAVRLVGSTEAALDGRGVRIEACGDPLALGPGDHVVRTARGRDGGVHLDRLVLASDPGGTPAALELSGAPVLPSAATAPRLMVLDAGDTSMRVRVDASDAPYWIVLGQSENTGWKLEEAGGRSYGRSTLVNGYANGWYVGAGGGSAREFTITWTPQRSVNLSLLVSLLGALACAALVVRGRRWRREPGPLVLAPPAGDGPAPSGDASAGECGPAAGYGSSDETPVATLPFVRHGRVRWYLVVTAAAGVGGATAAVVAPSVGAGMATAVVLAAGWRRGRWVLAAAAVGLAVAATARVVDVRSSNPDERSFELFTRLQRPHWLVLAAVMALVADVVVSALGDRARPTPGEAAGEVPAAEPPTAAVVAMEEST